MVKPRLCLLLAEFRRFRISTNVSELISHAVLLYRRHFAVFSLLHDLSLESKKNVLLFYGLSMERIHCFVAV